MQAGAEAFELQRLDPRRRMKFSSSLKFNALPEWWDEYIAYDALKKYIYQLEKQQHNLAVSARSHDLEAATGSEERAPLFPGADGSSTDAMFTPLLDRELQKIVAFYEAQEKEIMDKAAELEDEVRVQEEIGHGDSRYELDDEDDEEDEEDDEGGIHSPSRSRERTYSDAGAQRKSRNRTLSSATGNGFDQPSSPRIQRNRRLSTASRSSGGDSNENNDEMDDSLGQLPDGPMSASGTMSRFKHKLKLGGMFDSITSSNLEAGAPQTIWLSRSSYAQDIRLLFKRRITTVYVSVSSLRSYVDVNYSGFRKILKKYDKVTDSELQRRYLHDVIEAAAPFTPAHKSKLSSLTNTLIDLYAKCVARGDRARAKAELRLHQREKIAWERDTVWRQMIGRERHGQGGGQTPKALGGTLGKGAGAEEDDSEEDEGTRVAVKTPVGRVRVTRRKVWMVVAVVVFVALLNTQNVDGVEANRCFALLVFATVLWATEAIPLFVTSLSVPFFLVVLRVIRSADGERLGAKEATAYVFSIMFSPTIMLLIGGFTISSALSKTNIDRVLITRVLSVAGTRPRTVLLAFMGVSCFASMWISNVAAPTLCFTLIKPILRTLPPKTSFAPCLILAIALAANIGGQSSPISSPQNLIALQEMDPPVSWGGWFAVAIPVSLISIILIWLLLLVSYRPELTPDGESMLEIKAIRPTRERFTVKQWWVVLVTLVTIALWCVESTIEDVVGDMGVIALVPVVAFFATGVLKKDDFEQFAWTIVFLAMGGIALGKGVMSSGLLDVMDRIIRDLVDGFSLYNVVLILSPVVLVISTFISHTIASVLLVPIAKEVGSNLPGNHANLLIFITGLICSTGMGMPVSGFPNQTAATQEDDLGVLYLSNVDFLKNGVPASIIATLVVATVGFLLMKAISL